jgi:hypothetical protein
MDILSVIQGVFCSYIFDVFGIGVLNPRNLSFVFIAKDQAGGNVKFIAKIISVLRRISTSFLFTVIPDS